MTAPVRLSLGYLQAFFGFDPQQAAQARHLKQQEPNHRRNRARNKAARAARKENRS